MATGSFFENVVPVRAEPKIGKVRIETLREVQCPLCPLNEEEGNLKHPKMKPNGVKNAEFYILGEAPGAEEDRRGKAFIGKSGQLLRSTMSENYDNLRIRWWNTVRCRPPENRTPAAAETECCRSFIEDDIALVKPDAILFVGGQAFKWATGVSSYARWMNTWFPVRIKDWVCWGRVVPHPAYVLRQGEDSYEALMLRHGVHDLLLYPKDRDPEAVSLEDIDKGIRVAEQGYDIYDFLSDPHGAFAFDLETASGEKGGRVFRPYGEDCEILCMALAKRDETLVVPASLVSDAIQAIQDRGKTTRLIAHNLAFDLEWLQKFYQDVWKAADWHCTMAQAYCLHERQGMSLNDLAAVLLALPDLKKRSGVNVQNLRNADRDSLHRYCGRDAAVTFKLWHEQNRMLAGEGLEEVYEDQRARVLPAVVAQGLGIKVHRGKAEALADNIEGYIADTEADFAEAEGALDLSSSKEIGKFLMEKGFEKEIRCDERKGGITTDDAALAKIDHPAVEIIQDYRRLSKLLNTYVAPLVPSRSEVLWEDGRAHPMYNMTKLVSRRSSCEAPNIQNQPKRNAVHSKMVRDLFIPSEGKRFLSLDYGQIEARVVAMASKDPFLVDSIRDNYDIHREWAIRILKEYPAYHPKGVKAGKKALDGNAAALKEARAKAKGWVFGNLFGSTIKGAVAHVGADERTVRGLYHDFWKRMPKVREWHKRIIDEYQNLGYVELLTGFRRHGPIRYNEIINTPIQGTAFDIVCDAWVRLLRESADTGAEWMFPAIQVHDDLTFEIPAVGGNVSYIAKNIVKTVFDWDKRKFPFINVPLTVEVSVGDSWGSMETFQTFSSEDFRQ